MSKPYIPDIGVSGRPQRINWMVWRNCVIDELNGSGVFHDDGLDAWARKNIEKLRVRYELGMRPSDAANEILETWPKELIQDDRRAIRAAVEHAKKTGNWNKELPKWPESA